MNYCNKNYSHVLTPLHRPDKYIVMSIHAIWSLYIYANIITNSIKGVEHFHFHFYENFQQIFLEIKENFQFDRKFSSLNRLDDYINRLGVLSTYEDKKLQTFCPYAQYIICQHARKSYLHTSKLRLHVNASYKSSKKTWFSYGSNHLLTPISDIMGERCKIIMTTRLIYVNMQVYYVIIQDI